MEGLCGPNKQHQKHTQKHYQNFRSLAGNAAAFGEYAHELSGFKC